MPEQFFHGVELVEIDSNRGLAEQGAIYPAGILITFPNLSASATAPASRPVRLWD